MDTYASVLTSVRRRNPLVLQITNAVTMHDCANMSICFGASPVMSDDPADAAELAAVSDALVLNIGTISDHQLQVMQAAAEVATDRHIPIILDPVGAGATARRREIASQLISAYPMTVIKGNADEIGALAGVASSARGVDSLGMADRDALMQLAETSGAVVVASGAVDVVTDASSILESRIFEVANGVVEMGMVSGTGCMAGSCIGAAAAVASPATASVAALAVLGIAGERAAQVASGPGTFKTAFFDAVSCMSEEDIAASARIREVVL